MQLPVDVILPCLDEAQALPGVLRSLPPGFRAIVVDNGSRDGTPEIAASLGARVVHESRKGYGAAVHTGLEAATTDVVAFIDADGSLDPAELPAMVALLHGAAAGGS
ncbi:MAG: glycosyltransferase family 2 protein, partial [Pseudonocardia sp.]|nr:glycosyltransferase family 2 protein [Pseudonocardia sp.]